VKEDLLPAVQMKSSRQSTHLIAGPVLTSLDSFQFVGASVCDMISSLGRTIQIMPVGTITFLRQEAIVLPARFYRGRFSPRCHCAKYNYGETVSR
jgi:hypothetical protein